VIAHAHRVCPSVPAPKGKGTVGHWYQSISSIALTANGGSSTTATGGTGWRGDRRLVTRARGCPMRPPGVIHSPSRCTEQWQHRLAQKILRLTTQLLVGALNSSRAMFRYPRLPQQATWPHQAQRGAPSRRSAAEPFPCCLRCNIAACGPRVAKLRLNSTTTGETSWREASTALVTSSETIPSAASDRSSSRHSHRICRVQARAQPGAVGTAPRSSSAQRPARQCRLGRVVAGMHGVSSRCGAGGHGTSESFMRYLLRRVPGRRACISSGHLGRYCHGRAGRRSGRSRRRRPGARTRCRNRACATTRPAAVPLQFLAELQKQPGKVMARDPHRAGVRVVAVRIVGRARELAGSLGVRRLSGLSSGWSCDRMIARCRISGVLGR
jgi:hypothetical protein